MRYSKRLRVGKKERYEFDVSAWLDDELLVSASITVSAAASQDGVTDIDGGVIGFYLQGVSAGVCTVDVSYATATRSDCRALIVYVEAC